MKKLSNYIAKGIIAETNFVENLTTLIEACPRIAEVLADNCQCPISEEEIKAYIAKQYNDCIIDGVHEPHLDDKLTWNVKIDYRQPRYYKFEDFSDVGSYTKSDNYKFVRMSKRSDVIRLQSID